MTKVKERIKNAEERTETEPTEKQKLKGNYKKGSFTFKGFKITIENPIGSIRTGLNKDGKQWSNEMTYSYGYFNGTVGKDGDPIDVYLGEDIENEFNVYVIDQVQEENRVFDEHKVMFGFKDAETAKKAYLSNYNEGWKGFGQIVPMTIENFRKWIKNADMLKYPASRVNINKRMNYMNVANMQNSAYIKLNREVIDGETLKDLKNQLNSFKNFETVVLDIASPGGSVAEGLDIMVWLDSLSQQGLKIITVVTANAYSIASLIMLAADVRLISKHGEVMVHNPMLPELEFVNANELEKYVSELRDLESMMYELYQLFTGLKESDIKNLMDNETFLSPEEAVKYGFADKVIEIEPKPYVQAVNTYKQKNMSKTLNILNRVIASINKKEFVNQMYYNVEGDRVEIYQQDPSAYKKGDKTNVESGEVKLSNGAKLIIKNFTIEDILNETEMNPNENGEETEPTVPSTTTEEKIEDPEKKMEGDMPSKVKETVETTVSTKETVAKEVDEGLDPKAEFNEGAAPKTEEDKPKAVEVDPEVQPQEEPWMPYIRSLEERISTLESEREGLQNKVLDLEKEKEIANKKFENLAEFENIATEAIDSLATNTVSNFKPQAKAKVTATEGGSIFQKMKAKRGL